MLLVTVISSHLLRSLIFYRHDPKSFSLPFALTFAAILADDYCCHMQCVAKESCPQGERLQAGSKCTESALLNH